uniref:LIM zinc-binding domain-containing protein n=1 Tax=Globodera rostochiensis TaxID=31243 RepID=A0A914HLI1_GLORO
MKIISTNEKAPQMALRFGMGGEMEQKNCTFCGEKIALTDRLMVDRETIHRNCFNCCLCGAKLQPGHAAMELSFYNRYGPRWYCSGSAGGCALTPMSEKDAKLKEKGMNTKK